MKKFLALLLAAAMVLGLAACGEKPVETTPAPGPATSTEAQTPTEPAKTEPAQTEPAKTEPAQTEPAQTEPAQTEPVTPPEAEFPNPEFDVKKLAGR